MASAEVDIGLIVAESTSPVGRGTAGLLLINGMPLPPPLSGTTVGIVIGENELGAGLGELIGSCRGRYGHGYDGDEETTPPVAGGGASIGGISGGKVLPLLLSGGNTLIDSF